MVSVDWHRQRIFPVRAVSSRRVTTASIADSTIPRASTWYCAVSRPRKSPISGGPAQELRRASTWESPPIGGFPGGSSQSAKKEPALSRGLRLPDGAGGIRTLDRGLSPYVGLANRCLQPLGHRSIVPDAIRASFSTPYSCQLSREV